MDRNNLSQYKTHPDSLVERYNDFSDMYDHAYVEEKEIITLGDINLRCSETF